MSHTLATPRSQTAKAVAPPSIRKTLAELWCALTPNLYRPERHYMRGPGPKWQAKHAVPARESDLGLGGSLSAA